MGKLEIKLENCYGIPKLDFETTVSKNKPVIIHASNGVMKTSLFKTMNDLNVGQIPKEQIYHLKSKAEIKLDNAILGKDDFYLVGSYGHNYEFSKEISNLLLNENLKNRYQTVTKNLKSTEENLLKNFENLTGIKRDDLDGLFQNVFQTTKLSEVLSQIVKAKIDHKYNTVNFTKYKLNQIFNDDIINFISQDETKRYLLDYQKHLKKLYKQNILFKEGFFEYKNLVDLRDNLEINQFFDADNRLLFNGLTNPIKSLEELNTLIDSLHFQLSNRPEFLDKIKVFTKQLKKNKRLKDFSQIISTDPELIINYRNLKKFKKEYLKNAFNEILEDVISYLGQYNFTYEEVEMIEKEAKLEKTLWQESVNEFNNIFKIPVKLKIVNATASILGNKTPIIEFMYKDIPVDKDFVVREVLSVGEQKALYLLNIMFSIKNIIKNKNKKILLFDDVADAFDYQNKHALLEYFSKIKENDFLIIILTNNFDFYRSSSRLSDRKNIFMTRKQQNEITIINGEYMLDVLSNFISNIENPYFLIACIPFARNLHGYKRMNSKEEKDYYLEYTNLLHYRIYNTKTSILKVIRILNSTFNTDVSIKSTDTAYKFILFQAKSILSNQSKGIQLEFKIVLSIAIRLSIEKYMISEITKNPNSINFDLWDRDTNSLINEYKKCTIISSKILGIIDRVQLFTPESIHLNSFMFEPLIDISIENLCDLYRDLLKITPWGIHGLKD